LRENASYIVSGFFKFLFQHGCPKHQVLIYRKHHSHAVDVLSEWMRSEVQPVFSVNHGLALSKPSRADSMSTDVPAIKCPANTHVANDRLDILRDYLSNLSQIDVYMLHIYVYDIYK
jgi:hypothetical protein